MYRAVLCPVLAYKMQGVVLSKEETTAIQAPPMTMVKHKFGVPSTTPESFWFARSGGRLTRLHAEYDRRAIEMIVRTRNGEGCTECRNLARWIEAAASKRLKFPGDPLAYPELAEATMSRITGESWWPNVTLILARRGINIGISATGEVEDPSIFTPARMGFAAIFWFHMAGKTIKEVTVAGATKDGPFSSTMAEIMAIVAVLAVLPSDVKATVWCDSQAAIAYTRLLQKKSDNSWRKSPQAYMAQFHIDRIRQRREPLKMKW
ncbi:hypothetical protein GGH94_005473, partial [Coemansia aciculifera]